MIARSLLAGATLVAALVAALAPALAGQHARHGDAPPPDERAAVHLTAQAIPLLTRAAPVPGGGDRLEGTLSQTALMARAAWWGGRGALDAMLDAEGLTMRRGELGPGAFGEGFVDRRHPHTYLHEVVVTGAGRAGPARLSASAGRGFAPFGTDDPMVRPFVKYPVNHHLAQILERGIALAAARLGPAILEGAAFTGEEPERPSSLPIARRFGDSWSARATILPAAWAELQASHARVASPEVANGFGLDQRKWSASARAASGDGARYALAEWARTVERDHARDEDAFAYESLLLEGALRVGPMLVALRLEQTGRPEEERTEDPFRTVRPAADLHVNGITRWRAATVHGEAAAVTWHTVTGSPFVELSRLTAAAQDDRAVFDPATFYGGTRFFVATVGLRLHAGAPHRRMGRYGVALAEPSAAPSGHRH